MNNKVMVVNIAVPYILFLNSNISHRKFDSMKIFSSA